MDIIPREELIDYGRLHLKTNRYLEDLMNKNQAILKVIKNDAPQTITLHYSFVWSKCNRKESFTSTDYSFCEAVETLMDKVSPPSKDNGVEARLNRIEEALTSLANKIKE